MIIRILIIVLVVLGFLLATMYGSFEELIFLPRKPHILEPSAPHKKIMIEDRLSAWHFDTYPGEKIILFFHGTYGNISYTQFMIDICTRQRFNLLVFDYSGYGQSHGAPDQKKACQDGEAAYKYLRQRYNHDEIILWGMSLGGAAATYVASRNKCAALILMSTFSSLDDILHDTYNGQVGRAVAKSVGFLINNMPSKNLIREVKCPTVIMHSRTDEVIPYTNALRLYDAIPHKCKKFVEIGGGHTTPVISTETLKEIFTYCCLDSSRCYLAQDILDDLPFVFDRYKQMEEQ